MQPAGQIPGRQDLVFAGMRDAASVRGCWAMWVMCYRPTGARGWHARGHHNESCSAGEDHTRVWGQAISHTNANPHPEAHTYATIPLHGHSIPLLHRGWSKIRLEML